MKHFLGFLAWVFLMPNMASAQSPVTKPDLVGRIRQSGDKLVISVENAALPNPNNGSGKAPKSKAELTLGAQTQTISVPELAHEGVFEYTVSIPSNLANQAFTARLKVDAPGAISESVESNNIFTKKFNECDLVLIKSGAGFLDMRWDSKSKPGIFSFKVKNEGARKTPVSVAQVLINEPGKPSSIQLVSIPAINPGATLSLEFKFAGSVCKTYFQVECDPGKRIEESNEGNNMGYIKPTCEN